MPRGGVDAVVLSFGFDCDRRLLFSKQDVDDQEQENARHNHHSATCIERLAQAVLAAHEEFPGAILADLYDPLTIPPLLAEAHGALDYVVDLPNRAWPFALVSDQVALLFERYSAAIATSAELN